MSVYKYFYVVYGIKAKFDEDFVEEYYKKEDQCKDLGIIIDGMNGDYIVFGDILFSNGDVEREGDVFEEFKITNLSSLDRCSFAYRKRFAKVFPDHLYRIVSKFNLLTFVHYT
jgi:hypothetical protein